MDAKLEPFGKRDEGHCRRQDQRATGKSCGAVWRPQQEHIMDGRRRAL